MRAYYVGMVGDSFKEALVSETSGKSWETWMSRLINAESSKGFFMGQSSFWTSVADGLCLVDKTLLARDAWMCPSYSSLVLRPPGFGKSLGLDMINVFYSIHFVQKGRSATVEEREEFFLTTRLGKEYPEFVRKHCGKHPVLFVSLQVWTFTFTECGLELNSCRIGDVQQRLKLSKRIKRKDTRIRVRAKARTRNIKRPQVI